MNTLMAFEGNLQKVYMVSNKECFPNCVPWDTSCGVGVNRYLSNNGGRSGKVLYSLDLENAGLKIDI